MALSHLGKLYDQVLKIKYRASDCFKKCLELAATLVPRILTTECLYFLFIILNAKLNVAKLFVDREDDLRGGSRCKYQDDG